MDTELLSILACPRCRGSVQKKEKFLTCAACSLAYPLLDRVPDMLLQDAWPLARAKKARFRHTLKL